MVRPDHHHNEHARVFDSCASFAQQVPRHGLWNLRRQQKRPRDARQRAAMGSAPTHHRLTSTQHCHQLRCFFISIMGGMVVRHRRACTAAGEGSLSKGKERATVEFVSGHDFLHPLASRSAPTGLSLGARGKRDEIHKYINK